MSSIIEGYNYLAFECALPNKNVFGIYVADSGKSEHKQDNLKFIIKVIPSIRLNLILDRWNVL